VDKYLEEFVARIDAPQIYKFKLLTLPLGDIDFEAPELNKFISRTPTLGAYDEARLIVRGSNSEALVRLRQYHPERSGRGMLEVKFPPQLVWQLSTYSTLVLAQICTLSLRLLLTMENLYIDGDVNSPLVWKDPESIESTEWLDLLLPFTAVKNLYLSKQISPRIALALQELTGGRTTEVLPSLQNVLLEEFRPSKPVHESIAQFVSERELTNHPVVISVWDRGLVEDKS